jgi:type VI secretion system secreted protein VgrG
MTVWAIINKIFSDAGFSGNVSDKRQNQAGSQTLEYCVQYNETSLDFVTRLMEVYGLYYYFTYADGQHTLVMADDPNSHTALSNPVSYATSQTEYRTVDAHIWDWTSGMALQPGTATFNDYNFTTPAADLTAKSVQVGPHTHGDYEVYEYPGPHGVAADGKKLADIRMQRFAAERRIFRGTTNARDIICGCRFTLQKFEQDTSQNREFLIISASYSVDAAEAVQSTQGAMADTFRCNFAAVPGTVPFQLACQTRWPAMRGPQTAKVVGNSGDEVTTDQYGRIKVQFYWDRLGQNNQDSSCWIRVAQIWAGTGWGGIYIPRVGQEVVVDFLDGNPDRPLVTGCVYNASTTVPYGLPDNKTRSTIKTNSSTGGGGFNELRFEDKKGSEEVFLQAQKDYNVVVLNNETAKITQDQTITVDKGNRSLTLNQGNNSVTVSKGNNSTTVSQGNNSTTVSQGNDSLTVSQGNHSITVSAGASSVTAQKSITLTVGSNSITIDGTGNTITLSATKTITLSVGANSIAIDSAQGITINGAKITGSATGPMTLSGNPIALN